MRQEQGFFWQRHVEAERLLLDALDDFVRRNEALAQLGRRMSEQASCRLFDWVDHLRMPESPGLRQSLKQLGFAAQPDTEHAAFYHPGALLPAVILDADLEAGQGAAALRVDSVADFLQVHNQAVPIEGSPYSPLRGASLGEQGGVALLVVERRGCLGYDPVTTPQPFLQHYFSCLDLWQTRPRCGADEDALWEETMRLAELLVARLGVHLAAQVVCLGERIYWQARNEVGRLQKGRQDTLGLGWGNHDHHTFRSSRRHFARLVNLFTRLGFEARERFYAGEQAGWGAQVMENRVAGLSLFLDVDLAPEELNTDFAHEELPERQALGTVGLWCALHGDSIFGAGMHHLAARCDFNRLVSDLALRGVEYMAPFSDFSYLKQAFSVAERWSVQGSRLEKLLDDRVLTEEQADTFLAEGAVGSHLEDIQRDEGYKGFNKKNVSAIIRKTDPRI